ncbi:Late embryogenesis abundant protein, LEA_2 subgroup [Dillenia turbinata]|uniref:Late embryogenesis abundant protein, LEA_2 subgroup n=1 Tax=Dillenia turbinata TaxID=194707 RepID=A0AAN8ZQW9_9MAGN
MSQTKQPHLNGAYYGPPIPPSQSYHRHGRGRGCDCCLIDCGCCLLSLILKIVITVVVIIGLAVFLFWLIVRPNKLKFHVTDATITQFQLATANNTLYYNLAVNMTIRNPNKHIGVYFDSIEARALYEDQRFDSVWLTPFYQGHKSTEYLNPAFDGQSVLSLGSNEISNYNSEKSSGSYSIDVKLYLKIRLKIGAIKTRKMKPKVECNLKIPVNQTAGSFQTTKCDVDT